MGQAEKYLFYPQARLRRGRLLQDRTVGRGPACNIGKKIEIAHPMFPANYYLSHSLATACRQCFARRGQPR